MVYAILLSTGDITDTTSNLPITRFQLKLLVNKTLESTKQRGKVRLYDEKSYRFLKAPLSKGMGSILVFVSTDPESEIIEELLAALTGSGLCGLVLVFLGGLFMAEKALVPIKKSWQRQKNFVADASHELRTPLAVIQTNLEIVLGNPWQTVESQAKWLENIHVENKRMAKLVVDLLFLARADSQQELLEMKNFPLHTILKDSLEVFEPVATGKNIKLEPLIESEIHFYGDENRIMQVAVILLDNAIKYTPSGGIVTLSLKDTGDIIEISVSDTGEGIKKDQHDKIFERFYRVDKARSKQSGGTGLGLSIAEWIIKEHHGSIKVTSSLGKGSTFKILLPKVR